MFEILAAAALAAAPPGGPAQRPVVHVVERPTHSLSLSQACPGAGRLETSFGPALLYREQDRATTQLKKLAEMPPGRLCLTGAGLEKASGR